MDVVVFFTIQGQIICQIDETASESPYSDTITIRNPALLLQQNTSVQFVPLGHMVKDKDFELATSSLLFKNPSVPVPEVESKYREIFGSIQVTSVMPNNSSGGGILLG